MKINGKVHCFFEQSGTFKNEFKKLGIPVMEHKNIKKRVLNNKKYIKK